MWRKFLPGHPTRCTLHKSTVRFSRGQARLGWESRRAGRGGQSRGSRAGGPPPPLRPISTPRLTATCTKDHTHLWYPSSDPFRDQQLILCATRLWVRTMEGLIKSGKHQWKRTWAFSSFLPAIKSAVWVCTLWMNETKLKKLNLQQQHLQLHQTQIHRCIIWNRKQTNNQARPEKNRNYFCSCWLNIKQEMMVENKLAKLRRYA